MSRLSGTGEGATTAAELACVGPLGATDVQTALNAIALSASLPAPGSSGNLLTSTGAAWVSAAPETPNVSSVTGTLALANGGTGQTTALAAFAALAPAPGAAGRVMISDGTVNWTASALAIADTTGTLALGRGGTGITSSGASGNVLRSNGAAWASAALTVADVSGAAPLAAPTFTGAVSMTGASSVVIPTVAWPSNTTNAASTGLVTAALAAFVPNVGSVTGTLALANGGTGATTQAGAANAILPAQSANFVLVSNGTNVSWSLASLTANVSGTLPFGNGGTGLTAVGSAGNVLRSTGSAWASAQLALTDTSGTLATGRGGTGLTASGVAGRVLRSDGSVWASAALGVADVTGAAPLAGPTFTATVSVGAFTATGAAVSLSGATSVTVPNVTPATTSSTAAANTAFVQSAILSASDPFLVQIQVDHGQTGTFAGQLGWVPIANGGGSLATFNSAVVTGADGHRTLNAGTTANGRSAMCMEATAGQLPLVQPWLRGPYVQEWLFQIPVISAAGATDFEFGVSLGAGAATNQTSFVSGFGVFCSGTAPVWQFASRNAGVTVVSSSGVSPVLVLAATWTYVRIELDTGGASGARCYIGTGISAATAKTAAGTTAVATITTVGSTALALGPMAKTSNLPASSTARNVIVALFASRFTPT